MIWIRNDKPKGHFEHLVNSPIWFEGGDDKGTYLYAAVEIVGQFASLHIHFLRWNHAILKDLLKSWKTLKRFCEERGCTTLVASNENIHDERWPKFIKHFGFPEPSLIWISKQEI